MPITKLIIVGKMNYTTNNDISYIIKKVDLPIIFIKQDVNSLKVIIESLPMVKQAIVSKQWPNKLIIHIIEYNPIAYWNDNNLLDYDGKVFTLPNKNNYRITLPIFYAPKGSEKCILTDYKSINKILKKAKIEIKEININNRYSWKLTLEDNIKIELGRKNKIERLKRLIIIYPILIKQSKELNKHISYIDLRYNSGLAVKWIN